MASDGFGAIVAAAIVGTVTWAISRTMRAEQEQPTQIVYERQGSSSNGVKSALFGLLGSALDNLPLGGGGPVNQTAPYVPPSNNLDTQVTQPTPTQPATGISGNIGGNLLSDLMRDFGLTRNQAAGVVGNLDHESGGFGSLQEIAPLVPGSRGGYGYAQWTGPRRREFEAWTKQQGLAPESYAANYGFLKHELTNTWEKKAIPALRNANSVDEATVIFQNEFLRPGIPHTNSRITRARGYA